MGMQAMLAALIAAEDWIEHRPQCPEINSVNLFKQRIVHSDENQCACGFHAVQTQVRKAIVENRKIIAGMNDKLEVV